MIKLKDILNEISLNDLNILQKHGAKIIEQENVYNYEVSLLDIGGNYIISLTSNNQEYFSPNSQNKKPSINKNNTIVYLKKIIDIVKNWIHKYKKLYIGSTNLNRVKYYYNWLNKDFECSDIKIYGYNSYNQSNEYFFTAKEKN